MIELLYLSIYSIVITNFIGLLFGFVFRGQLKVMYKPLTKIAMGLTTSLILIIPHLFYEFSVVYFDTIIFSWLVVSAGILTSLFTVIPLILYQILRGDLSSIVILMLCGILLFSPYKWKYLKTHPSLNYFIMVILLLFMINIQMVQNQVILGRIIFMNGLFIANIGSLIGIDKYFYRYNLFFHFMKKYAIIDQQSQLLNRVYFDDHYEGKETNQSFAIINIDLFKNYEILYGYTITNKIMIEMSQLILNRLKDIGLVFRYNSDQFYVLFQETEGDVCHKRIHLLKDEIDNFDLSIENNSIHLTVSIGLILNQNWTLMEQLILDGQQALFQSKILGRNKITIA